MGRLVDFLITKRPAAGQKRRTIRPQKRTFPMVVRTAERPIGNSVRPFGSPVPKPRSGPPDLDRPKQYEWPQSTTLFPSLPALTTSLIINCVSGRPNCTGTFQCRSMKSTQLPEVYLRKSRSGGRTARGVSSWSSFRCLCFSVAAWR